MLRNVHCESPILLSSLFSRGKAQKKVHPIAVVHKVQNPPSTAEETNRSNEDTIRTLRKLDKDLKADDSNGEEKFTKPSIMKSFSKIFTKADGSIKANSDEPSLLRSFSKLLLNKPAESATPKSTNTTTTPKSISGGLRKKPSPQKRKSVQAQEKPIEANAIDTIFITHSSDDIWNLEEHGGIKMWVNKRTREVSIENPHLKRDENKQQHPHTPPIQTNPENPFTPTNNRNSPTQENQTRSSDKKSVQNEADEVREWRKSLNPRSSFFSFQRRIVYGSISEAVNNTEELLAASVEMDDVLDLLDPKSRLRRSLIER